MTRLLYMAITSLDGYVADEAGRYDWAMPDDEVFGFINDFERPVGTYLYGRRLYEDMTGWETMDADPGLSPLMLDFAREMKARSERDITVGGAELAAQAIGTGLVDEIHLIISPVLVGGGKKALSSTVRLQLELLDERRFGSGVVLLRYRVVA